MVKKGKDLAFISQIDRDGKGTTPKTNEDVYFLMDEDLELSSLSLSNLTHIATDKMNYYVVKVLDQVEQHYNESSDRHTECGDIAIETHLEYYRDKYPENYGILYDKHKK